MAGDPQRLSGLRERLRELEEERAAVMSMIAREEARITNDQKLAKVALETKVIAALEQGMSVAAAAHALRLPIAQVRRIHGLWRKRNGVTVARARPHLRIDGRK